jgi:3-methylcrotonyl-CoA carboxylase alpha subunit
VLAAAILRILDDERREAESRAAVSADRWSPWNQRSAWRMNGSGYQDVVFQDGESKALVRIYPQADGGVRAVLAGYEMHLRRSENAVWIDGVKTQANVIRRGDRLTVIAGGITHELRVIDALAPRGEEEEAEGSLVAPMPGRIIQVLTAPGDEVKRGAALVVLEAMKMEYTITAPADGKIELIRYAAGDIVNEGAELIVFAREES